MLSIILCKVSMIPLTNAPQTPFQKKNQHQYSSEGNFLHLPGCITRLSYVRVLRDSSLQRLIFWTFSSLKRLGKIVDFSRSGLVGFTYNFIPVYFDPVLYHQDFKLIKRLKHERFYYILRVLNWLGCYELLQGSRNNFLRSTLLLFRSNF